MSARLPFAAAGLVLLLSGCTSSKRVFSADRDDGRVAELHWRLGERIEASRCELDAEGVPKAPVSDREAVTLANAELPRYVKKPAEWSLAHCRLIEFQPGCYGWSVRFDRKGAFDDAQASDRYVKFYVLFDKSVVAPALSYDN